MRTVLKGTLAVVGCVALAAPALAQFGGPPPPPNTGIPLYTKMVGGSGSGNVTVVIDPPKGTACYIMNVSGLEGVTAAHIHSGEAGANGRVVVPFETPEGGTSGGCVPVTADISAAILGSPQSYYVNVHTRAFPAGAIRGQLAK